MFNLCALSPKGILSLRKFHLKKDPFVRILSFQTNIFKEFVLQCRFYVRNIVSRNYSYWKYSCGEHFVRQISWKKVKISFFCTRNMFCKNDVHLLKAVLYVSCCLVMYLVVKMVRVMTMMNAMIMMSLMLMMTTLPTSSRA